MGPEDLGPVIGRRRGGVSTRLWGRAVILALDLWLVGSLVRMVAGSREHFVRDVLALLVAALAVVAVLGLGVFLAARRRRYDIHQHGLLLSGPGDTNPVVVPWSTLDPGRVLVSRPPRGVQAWTPRGLVAWAARPPTVLVNGWGHLPDDAEPYPLTDAEPSPLAEVRGPSGPEPRSRVAGPHRYETGASDSPFAWWQLEVADPVDLLTVVESAMVADGHRARGLAEAALERRYVDGSATRVAARELQRGLTDSAIGLGRD